MQMDKLVRCIGEIICERSWRGGGQMVDNDTVRGNGLTEILPICRVSKVRTCSNDMSLASVRWFISTRLPFYKMFRPISFALNVTKYFMLRYYQYFLHLLLRVYKLSFSKVNHVIFQIFNFISREKILSDYSSKYDKKFLKIFDCNFDYIPILILFISL